MLNWNDVEKVRLHREDLLREASAGSRSLELDRPRHAVAAVLALLVAVHHWLMAA